MKALLAIGLIFLSTQGKAAMTVGHADCPQEFEGEIVKIAKFVDDKSSLNLQKVNFRTLASLKGDVKEEIAIEMLEHGPFQVNEGEEYRVQLKDGKLCWIEKI